MKIVFFGTSAVGLPILEALIKEHEVVHIVTSPDAPVGRKQIMTASPIADFAASHNLPISKPLKVKKNEEFISFLDTLQADIFVVVSYGKILPLELINLPRLRTVNIHFSLLPKYRGASPIQFTLLNGDTQTGTTIFVLDEQMDTGPILAQAMIPIEPDDTFTSLASKLATLSSGLLIDLLPKYNRGEITPQPQDNAAATYVTLITKTDGKIDWTKSATDIHNQFRAFVEWPGIWTTWQGKQLKVLACSPIQNMPGTPGTVQDNIVYCGNNSALELHTVQLEGKSPQDIATFLNGYQQFRATQLDI